MRLAIADPPYPPIVRAAGPALPRASRWYGNAPASRTDVAADVHAEAREWDDPARRTNRGGAGLVPNVLICDAPSGFIGAKPMQWTHWVLDAMGYDAEHDTVRDLFPGSGAVTSALAQSRLFPGLVT